MKMRFISAAAAVFQLLLYSDYVVAGALARDFSNKKSANEPADTKEPYGAETKTSTDEGATTTTGSTSEGQTASETGSTDATSKGSTATSESSETTIPTPKKIEGDPIVIRIGHKEFKRSDALKIMSSLPKQLIEGIPHDKLFYMVCDQMVSEYLIVEQANKAGLEKTEEFAKGIAQMRKGLLVRLYLLKEIYSKIENEQTLRARHIKYVAEFKKAKESHLYHIMVDSENNAKKILELLKNGEDFSAIAEKESVAHSKKNGGDEGFIQLDKLSDPIKSKLTALKPGEYTKEFIKTEDGFHIFRVTESRDTAPQKFEDCKGILREEVFQEEFAKLMDRLKKQYNVEIFEEDGTPIKATKATEATPVVPAGTPLAAA
ncbi:MAG: peptidyl-prolyl cis-trans isomerase [Holosporaceae bacterium]|jgi:hypothetical protein|nr:peptidyl-prolyl cis-trans isomerase [Holosporaceae bacterium]